MLFLYSIYSKQGNKPTMVAVWVRVCVKFKYTLTRRAGFESPLRVTISTAQQSLSLTKSN